jgi:DNA-binding response OmpR family regulator
VTKILVVEDNDNLAFALRESFEMEGFDVVRVADGELAVEEIMKGDASLIVLDVMLPKLDGFRVLRRIRDASVETPVLMLTARGTEDDKIRGLRLGADDYLTKPFGVRELLARVDALLRRERRLQARLSSNASSATGAFVEAFVVGDLEILPAAHIVRRGGAEVELRPKEFELLNALFARRGAVMSRDELLRQVWGYHDDVSTRTVDIHVVELRRKLERDPANPKLIVTVRKAGYRLDG